MAAEILSLLFFPFIAIFFLAIFGLAIALFAFWIWMLVDAAQRTFKNESEKIVWILIIVLVSWIGSIIYYFVVYNEHKKGISKKK